MTPERRTGEIFEGHLDLNHDTVVIVYTRTGTERLENGEKGNG